jgi:hypothetical protein
MTHRPITGDRSERFVYATSDAELFCEPSGEALRLLRWLPSLTSPHDGRGALPWHALRVFLVAPFTQLTFVSFDLQMFLFDVFHTTRVARVGHFAGMVGVNLFALALAVRESGSPLGGAVVAALLLAWYAVVARAVRLALWWWVMVMVVAALLVAACALGAVVTPRALAVGVAISGAVVSLSHAFEPLFPPRAGDPLRWLSVAEYVWGPTAMRNTAGVVALRALRVASFTLIGWFDEMWAAPRLLPYNVLRLMLRAGYAPTLRATLDDRARRAWASGNPALDFVGVGGGSFLAR